MLSQDEINALLAGMDTSGGGDAAPADAPVDSGMEAPAEAAAATANLPGPADGFAWIKYSFSNPVYVVLYVIWIVAIWFHLSHGFWSALQTLGWNGKTWFCRWKLIGMIYVTLLMLMFLVVVLAFAFGCAPSLCAGSCCA